MSPLFPFLYQADGRKPATELHFIDAVFAGHALLQVNALLMRAFRRRLFGDSTVAPQIEPYVHSAFAPRSVNGEAYFGDWVEGEDFMVLLRKHKINKSVYTPSMPLHSN